MGKTKGSHGKTKYFTVTSVVILNSVTNAKRYDNCNFEQKLGNVPGHKQPPNKTLADAQRVANEVITLYNNESIIDITWGHYTQ